MAIELNATHDPARRSWVESANDPDTDFPIQNLPFCTFQANMRDPTVGVGLGDRIIDLDAVLRAGLLSGPGAGAANRAPPAGTRRRGTRPRHGPHGRKSP